MTKVKKVFECVAYCQPIIISTNPQGAVLDKEERIKRARITENAEYIIGGATTGNYEFACQMGHRWNEPKNVFGSGKRGSIVFNFDGIKFGPYCLRCLQAAFKNGGIQRVLSVVTSPAHGVFVCDRGCNWQEDPNGARGSMTFQFGQKKYGPYCLRCIQRMMLWENFESCLSKVHYR